MTKSLVLSAFCLLLVCVSAEEPASDGSWAQDATLHVKDSEALSGMTATLVKKLNTEKAQLDSNLEEARVAKVTAQEKLAVTMAALEYAEKILVEKKEVLEQVKSTLLQKEAARDVAKKDLAVQKAANDKERIELDEESDFISEVKVLINELSGVGPETQAYLQGMEKVGQKMSKLLKTEVSFLETAAGATREHAELTAITGFLTAMSDNIAKRKAAMDEEEQRLTNLLAAAEREVVEWTEKRDAAQAEVDAATAAVVKATAERDAAKAAFIAARDHYERYAAHHSEQAAMIAQELATVGGMDTSIGDLKAARAPVV